MKKLYLFLLCLCSLSSSAQALYFGNPAEADLIEEGFFMPDDAIMKVKLGYIGDIVFDRRLKAYAGAAGNLNNFSFRANQGLLTLVFIDRIEAFGSVGAAKFNFVFHPRPDHPRREYQSFERVTWGTGLRGTLFQINHVTVGMEGGFQWANPHFRLDAFDVPLYNAPSRMKYREWQLGIGATYQIDDFFPYVGVKYSYVKGKMIAPRISAQVPHAHFNLRSRDHFGIVLGCTLTTGKIFDITAESRLIDEESVSFAGNIKF